MPKAGSLSAAVLEAIRGLPPEAQVTALHSLREFETTFGLTGESLSRVLSDDGIGEDFRAFAAWITGATCRRKLAGLLVHLTKSNLEEKVLWEVVKALCALRKGEDAFLSLLRSPVPVARAAAAYGLGCLGSTKAGPELCRLLLDATETPSVRGHAAEALGQVGSASSLEALLEATHVPEVEVRFWATYALGRIGAESATSRLEELIATDHEVLDGWWSVSEEASSALREISGGEPESE
ncbi:MAG: HEAT repeat domain-containing protein [Thermoanaerobaculia bacterium]|nr:HEAT repeat domain-containing protein [Thermoanaerobaculia bacterium]